MKKADDRVRRRAIAAARKLVHDRLLAIESLLECSPEIRPRGKKFIILRADGKPIPRTARYFVLRLDHHHPDGDKNNWETWAARNALVQYIRCCGVINSDRERWAPECVAGRKAAKLALRRSK